VQHYAPYFADVFSAEAFIQFERYISGLIVSENKTVDGINRLFVFESRNQSSLNRLLTESPFALEDLNQARLKLLDSLPGTQMKRHGVLSVDDTFLVHYGDHFDQIAHLVDPTTGNYVWAHDLVNLHYSDDDTDYPARFQLWKPTDVDALEQGLVAAGINLKWPLCTRASSSSRSICCENGSRPIPTSSCPWRLTTGTHNPGSAAIWTRPCSCRMWGHWPTMIRSS
jgi:hypothetical protein